MPFSQLPWWHFCSDDTSRIIAPSQLLLLITIVASCHQHHFACRFITLWSLTPDLWGTSSQNSQKVKKIQNVSSKRLPEEKLLYIRFIYFFFSFQVSHHVNLVLSEYMRIKFVIIPIYMWFVASTSCLRRNICMHSCMCAWGVLHI